MTSRAFVLAALLTACATADHSDNHITLQPDAGHGGTPIDAPPNTNPASDAPPSGCTTQTTDLLANGNLDGAPVGGGWTTKPIDPTYPIISPDMPPVYAAASAPNTAWMGGFAQTGANDSMYQDVTVPAGATQLRLTGSYLVLTAETGTTAKDRATVELRSTGGTAIESVLALDNTSNATAWTPLDHTFATASAGQTVRLYFSSSNTATNVTDFFYDSLQLVATHCD
jgi:hypothetical protein